jgi:hypothetical protein
MNAIQICRAVSSLTFCVYWWLVLRAALRAGPGWTWGPYGNPVRFDRNETIVIATIGVMTGLGFAVADTIIFAR